MPKRMLVVFSLVAISGCNGGSGSSNSPQESGPSTVASFECPEPKDGEFTGCWVTEECGQLKDNSGNLHENWQNLRMAVTNSEQIQLSAQMYSNNSCAGDPIRTLTSSETVFSYRIIDSITDESGISAVEMEVFGKFENEEPFTIATRHFLSSDDRLCLSENFSVEFDSFTLSPSASQAIDFNSCLVRAE